MADEETILELEVKAKPILERKARRRRTVTYQELAREIGPEVRISDLSPHDRRLHYALGSLSVKTFARSRILLSAIVINKQSGLPGNGFFWLATEGLSEEGYDPPYGSDIEKTLSSWML